MEPSKLSSHSFIKGKFITPFNTIPGMIELPDEESWVYGRLPEYLWMGLIFNKYGREGGLKALYSIIRSLHEIAPDLHVPRMSSILSLPEDKQRQFYQCIKDTVDRDTLAPLTLFCTLSHAPEFSNSFYSPGMSIEVREDTIKLVMQNLMDHQSNDSTDIRFVVLYFGLLSGHLVMMKDQIERLLKYPYLPHTAEEMRLIRPLVRSSEMMLLKFEPISQDYLNLFWGCISEMTECKLFGISFPEDSEEISLYMENVHEIFAYFSDLYVTVSPLDEKMTVLIGIATYSYKRFKELYDHGLFSSIAGRSGVRVMIEAFIMMKYLVANEGNHENIWRDYQLYGLGLYKLVLARHRESVERALSHFDLKYIDLLVNEFKNEEFINMDTKYFDKQNIRLKAESVGEKDLFGLYYDYDSSFEHAMWGAVRESALLKCDNPTHQYHCVPDINGQQNLKSVFADCVMVMNKTISFIRDLYGIPEELYKEVLSFEQRYSGSKDLGDSARV